MARLNHVEKTSAKEIGQLNDNARLKSILNNDSSNTSNPPSTDQKSRKSANTYNGRKKTGRRAGGQPGHKGYTTDFFIRIFSYLHYILGIFI